MINKTIAKTGDAVKLRFFSDFELLPPLSRPTENRPQHAAYDLPSDLAADGMGGALCHGAEEFGRVGLRLSLPPSRLRGIFRNLCLLRPLLQPLQRPLPVQRLLL